MRALSGHRARQQTLAARSQQLAGVCKTAFLETDPHKVVVAYSAVLAERAAVVQACAETVSAAELQERLVRCQSDAVAVVDSAQGRLQRAAECLMEDLTTVLPLPLCPTLQQIQEKEMKAAAGMICVYG